MSLPDGLHSFFCRSATDTAGISQMKPKGKNRYAPIYLKQLSDGLAVALIPDSLKECLGYTITAVNNIPLDTLIIRTPAVWPSRKIGRES